MTTNNDQPTAPQRILFEEETQIQRTIASSEMLSKARFGQATMQEPVSVADADEEKKIASIGTRTVIRWPVIGYKQGNA